MSQGLLIIDIQRDYFPGGAYPLVGADAAAEKASSVLAAFRAGGRPVVHLQHVWDAPEATFFRPGTDGVQIHPLVTPVDGEPVLQKSEPNGFVGTELAATLAGADIDDVVIVGMMSSMCVDATTRAAIDQALSATVVHDGCAAPDLEFGGESIPGTTVHRAFMAALADAGATVCAAADLDG
jgi:nicotinamidase-related amidase